MPRIEEAPPWRRLGDIDLILATDAEQILGIGDWGVGGIEVSIGRRFTRRRVESIRA